MRVALANPPFSKLVYGDETSIKSITPCLGLFYLKSYCDDLAEIEIFEGEFYESNDKLIDAINEFNPDILGVTTNTSTYGLCRELAKEVEAKWKFAGGPYSSFRVDETLLDFDHVFFGDAELGFRAFLEGKPFDEIPGCAQKGANGKILRTKPKIINNLDEIPFPNHRAMQIGLYQASPHRQMPTPFATMMTTRGCGFSCSFCLSAQGGMNGGKYRERSIENVVKEVESLINHFGIKSIQFWDDTFTMQKERTKALCKELKRVGISYVCNTRTDKIDEEIAETLAESGCQNVFFGIESGDINVLKNNIIKGVTNETVEQAFRVCRKTGLQTTASYIFGSIDDTEISITNTINFASILDADYVLFNIYTAHPGTHGYYEAIQRGIINHYTVDTNKHKGEPVGVPTVCTNLSRQELHALKDKAYIHYYSSKDPLFYRDVIETYEADLRSLSVDQK